MEMKLMKDEWRVVRQTAWRIPTLFAKNAKRVGHPITAWMLAMGLAAMAWAQAVSTTTVEGTVYLANGQPGSGTLVISWPAFTTAAGQAVAADSTTMTIGPDGFVSVNLAPNVGATPAGEYYTAVFDMSDGTTSTQYWVVPSAAQATLAQVEAQVMPAAQAVQAVSKAYVDQSIAELAASGGLSANGGTLTGPLTLSGDPTQPLQAADKHYVDTQAATAVPLAGGNMTGALTTPAVNGVESPSPVSSQTTLQAAVNAAGTNGAMTIPPTYAGTDTFSNSNGVMVTDLRTGGAQQRERSVKEFGAVCDGATDDTNAMQAAINYANAHGVALTIPQGTCKTRTLSWHGESIGGLGKQVSALMGFPGQDVLASGPDATNMLSSTRLHDLTIYVDQSVDVSCTPAKGRAAAGSCQVSRAMESNSIFSPGGNGLTGTAGTGAAWSVGNCAIAMQAATGAGGNGLRVAEMENVEIAATGVDPMAAQYAGAHSTHTCGMYLAQWPQWSEFRNIDIRGVNTGVAIPALPVTAPAGLNADSNRWQNVTIQAAHAFTAAAGSNNVLDNVVAVAGNSAATAEPPTGLVLDLSGNGQNPQQGWTVRNAVVLPSWMAVQPALTVTTASGAVTAVALGSEHGLGWDPYGASVPVAFSGACTAQATAAVNSNGSLASVTVTQGGVGCSATTTAGLNAAGTWDTAAPVNLVGGQNMTFFAGNLLKGNGGYTVWNAGGSTSYGTQLDGGGGTLPGGGSYAALVGSGRVGAAFQVDQFPGADVGAKIQACVNAVNASYGGTCDARNFSGPLSMGSNLTISTGNVAILLPCATITTANQIRVTAGTRNVALRGCALRGGTAASGSVGGTALAYTGTGAMVQVGDPTYATDTQGFHLDNVVINTTGATSATAQGLAAYRTQEMDVESVYFLGNQNQTGMTLDGTGNYTGGTYFDTELSGFGTAVNAIGHQAANPATTDWMNASTFVRLHIVCPTSSGNPISGTYGINLQQGDGNTFTGGDVEGCSTALHLGPNAQNNTIVGLRNENSTNQVAADAGSAYNLWITGGTMYNGKLTDNGTRNSFQDAFHRADNNLNGDLWRSQADTTVTNHIFTGMGLGNVRGRQDEWQTDVPGTANSFQNAWLWGPGDGTSGQQVWELEDLLNNTIRFGVQQNTTAGGNDESYLNAAGTGNVCFNCSTNSGTGGVTFASGGATPAAVATVDSQGNGQFVGNLQVNGTTQSAGTMTVRNNADAEADFILRPGLTASQKGSLTYRDWNGTGEWYLVKDANNNWALNSGTGGLDSFKAYQSTNSGDTYIDASNSTGHIRLNYESGSGAETDIYSGSSTSLTAAFVAPNAIKLPGLAASSGDYCLQIDNSGYVTNTGLPCGSGSGSGGVNGTINSGNTGQIAYYTANGATIGGMGAVPLTAGGTGATSASGALANLLPGTASDGSNGLTTTGHVTAQNFIARDVSNMALPAGTLHTSGGSIPDNSYLFGAVEAYFAGGEHTGTSDRTEVDTNACAVANTCSITWSWNAVPGADHYELWVVSFVPDTYAESVYYYSTTSTSYTQTAASGSTGTYSTANTTGGDVTASDSVTAPNLISSLSPEIDIRAYGAAIDGATDIGSALASAMAACPSSMSGANGASCTVLLPCGGAGCYLANGSLSLADGSPIMQFKLQGTLSLGSTLVMPDSTSFIGDAGGGNADFQIKGPTAAINGPQVSGTLGTAITTTGSPVTFTPTFTAGSIANFQVNSAITVAGTTNGTASAVGTAYSSGPNATYTFSSYTRIPAGSIATVTGCANSSYDINQSPVISADYSAQTLTLANPNVTASGSTTGCTVTGFNEDSFETVLITAVTGSTVTAQFMHTHSAGDQFGMAATEFQYNTNNHHDLENISVQNCLGDCLWIPIVSDFSIANDGFTSAWSMTSVPVEDAAGGLGTIRDSALVAPRPNTCTSDCGAAAYPAALRCTYLLPAIANQSGCGFVEIYDTTFFPGGVKVDSNGVTAGLAMPNFYNDQFREVPQNAITVDNRYGSMGSFIADSPVIEDDFSGSGTICYLGFTDAAQNGGGPVEFRNVQAANGPCLVNTYYNGTFSINGFTPGGFALPYGRGVPVGTLTNGGQEETELRGIGAGLGPSVIPSATLATSTPSMGSGVTVSSVEGPDGSATSAIELDNSSGTGPLLGGQISAATYTGDWFLYGTWARRGANQTTWQGPGGTPLVLASGGTDTLSGNYLSSFDMEFINDWWHPVVGLATVTAGESTAHTMQLRMYAGPYAGEGNRFYGWFWMHVPGPNNPAYTGVTQDEVERWRQQLMHGYVPSNMPGGGVLAMHPAHKLYWGNDTDLYRGAAGVVQTDGMFNAASGYEVNGSALATGNLADWTNSGAASGSVPVWNAATSKWTPGAMNAVQVNGAAAPASAQVLGSNSSSQLVAATAAQIASAIGATAVANATSATNFTGSLSGDVTGTQSATSVGKINGGAVPVSASVLGTNASGQPVAATAAQIASAIGATAVANATSATNFTGSLSGDVTGTQSATSVGKVNGGAVPASASVLGTNASGQPVAASTTGSGSVVLASSPTLAAPTVTGTLAGASETLSGTLSVTGTQTLTGATTMQGNVTLANGANSNQTLAIQPGSSADQIGAVQFNNYSGTAEWQLRKDANNYLRVTDTANSLDRAIFPPNANTTINAGAGANAVVVNNTSGSGTSGFIVYEGGSNYSTAAFQVTGSGNTTATGFLQGKFIMGTGTMTMAAGAAAGTSPSIACATSHLCDGVSGTVTLTTGTSPTTGTLATLSFPNTHTNQANCIVDTQSSTAVITSNTWTESTTAITITANTALSASTAYTIKYWCGGY
jgi:hypothetical protein